MRRLTRADLDANLEIRLRLAWRTESEIRLTVWSANKAFHDALFRGEPEKSALECAIKAALFWIEGCEDGIWFSVEGSEELPVGPPAPAGSPPAEPAINPWAVRRRREALEGETLL